MSYRFGGIADENSMSNVDDELSRRGEVLPRSYRLFYRKPVYVRSARGSTITEQDGTVLIDAYNNVPVVGHSNPVVAERVCAQLKEHNTHTRYVNPNVADYAERLLATFDKPLDRVIFSSTGSESNDLATQVARVVTGNRGIIVTNHAYHGTTTALHALSPSLSNFWITPDTGLIDVPKGEKTDAEFAEAFLASLDAEIERLTQNGSGVAALLVDSLMTSDGIFPFPLGLLREAGERVQRAGGLWIADEVQSGFGRVGTHWWGYQRHGGQPDLVVLGKPMGNGLPIAALVGSHHILDAYGDQFRYFNTFGGNPVCLAAAEAVLDEIEDRALLNNAVLLGDTLNRMITEVIEASGLPFRVRSAGLMLGLDTGSMKAAGLLANLMRERGVLVGTSGVDGEVLKVRPPLVIDENGIERIASALAESLRDKECEQHMRAALSNEGAQ